MRKFQFVEDQKAIGDSGEWLRFMKHLKTNIFDFQGYGIEADLFQLAFNLVKSIFQWLQPSNSI